MTTTSSTQRAVDFHLKTNDNSALTNLWTVFYHTDVYMFLFDSNCAGETPGDKFIFKRQSLREKGYDASGMW